MTTTTQTDTPDTRPEAQAAYEAWRAASLEHSRARSEFEAAARALGKAHEAMLKAHVEYARLTGQC